MYRQLFKVINMGQRSIYLRLLVLVLVVLYLTFTIQKYRLKEIRVSLPLQQTSMVLLLAYQRSGSTFTADIIQQSPDVFYVYEPFYFCLTDGYYRDKDICNNFSGTCRKSTDRLHDPSFAVDSLKKLFMCDIMNLPDKVMETVYKHPSQSRVEQILTDCIIKTQNRSFCLTDWKKLCLNSVRAMKVLRMSASLSEQILKSFQNLKIVHLIRDPRGIISSKIDAHPGNTPLRRIKDKAKFVCDRYKTDIVDIKYLDKLYPGRVKTIQYETLAEKPVETSRNLYSYLGLEFTKDTEKWINAHTHGKDDNGRYHTVRQNSTQTSQAWRSKLPYGSVKDIDYACKDVYSMLGYNAIYSEADLRNPAFKTLRDKIDFVSVKVKS